MENANRALFLDLDNTLIVTKSGKTFPENPQDWQIAYENVIGKLHQYKAKGYKLIVVTNQGGVESNFITEKDLLAKFDAVRQALQRPESKKEYIHFYYTPSMSGFYRKPSPGMAYLAAIEHELDLSASIMVGDMGSDKMFASRAGISTFFWPDDFFDKPTRQE